MHRSLLMCSVGQVKLFASKFKGSKILVMNVEKSLSNHFITLHLPAEPLSSFASICELVKGTALFHELHICCWRSWAGLLVMLSSSLPLEIQVHEDLRAKLYSSCSLMSCQFSQLVQLTKVWSWRRRMPTSSTEISRKHNHIVSLVTSILRPRWSQELVTWPHSSPRDVSGHQHNQNQAVRKR